jgi:hypothetical protein
VTANGPVTWRALGEITERVAKLETAVGQMADRIAALEREVARWQDKEEDTRSEHRTRIWQGALAIVTGLVLPLLTIGALALIHLATKG